MARPTPTIRAARSDRVEQVLPGARLRDDALADLLELAIDRGVVADADLLQRGAGLVVAADHDEPARALRHPQHPDPERQRRDRAESQHPAPSLARLEDQADDVGEDDSDRHRELEERDEPAALLRRRDLGDVDRGGRGGEADRDADEDAGDDEHRLAAGGGADDRADREDDGGDEDHQPAAVRVRQAAGEHRADDGAEGHRGDDQPGLEARQAEVRGDEEQGARDDAGVVAEQQSAETGDRGGHDDLPLSVLVRDA